MSKILNALLPPLIGILTLGFSTLRAQSVNREASPELRRAHPCARPQ